MIILMLPPLYFIKLKYFPAWKTGLICLAAPLGLVITARISAKMIPRFGTHILMLCGFLIMVTSLILLTQIRISWSTTIIFLLLLAYGVGGGLFQTPCYFNLTAQFSQQQQVFISALTCMIQNLGIAFEAMAAAVFISTCPHEQGTYLLKGIQHSWLMTSLISIVATLVLAISFIKHR